MQQLSMVSVYLLNQDFITEKFCVNKDKPELECNGKCHMKDVMAQQEEKNDVQYNGESFVMVFFEECIQEMPVLVATQKSSHLVVKTLSSSYEGEMFQPPQV